MPYTVVRDETPFSKSAEYGARVVVLVDESELEYYKAYEKPWCFERDSRFDEGSRRAFSLQSWDSLVDGCVDDWFDKLDEDAFSNLVDEDEILYCLPDRLLEQEFCDGSMHCSTRQSFHTMTYYPYAAADAVQRFTDSFGELPFNPFENPETFELEMFRAAIIKRCHVYEDAIKEVVSCHGLTGGAPLTDRAREDLLAAVTSGEFPEIEGPER